MCPWCQKMGSLLIFIRNFLEEFVGKRHQRSDNTFVLCYRSLIMLNTILCSPRGLPGQSVPELIDGSMSENDICHTYSLSWGLFMFLTVPLRVVPCIRSSNQDLWCSYDPSHGLMVFLTIPHKDCYSLNGSLQGPLLVLKAPLSNLYPPKQSFTWTVGFPDSPHVDIYLYLTAPHKDLYFPMVMYMDHWLSKWSFT